MKGEAHTFFEEWTASLPTVDDDGLRERSRARLNETRLTFGEILSAGRRAAADFDIFMAALRDQIVCLGYDPNPSAVARLSGDAKTLNAQADLMFQSVDALAATIHQHAGSTKAR